MRPSSVLLACALLASSLSAPARAQAPERQPAAPATPAPASSDARTAKERLSDKASDQQRVNDCKVPRERRTRQRPAACPWDPVS